MISNVMINQSINKRQLMILSTTRLLYFFGVPTMISDDSHWLRVVSLWTNDSRHWLRVVSQDEDEEELSVVQRSSCHLWLVWMLATSCLMYGSCRWMSNWLLLHLVWFQMTTAKQRFVGQCREDRMWCATIVSDVSSSSRGMNYFTPRVTIHPSIQPSIALYVSSR